MGRAPCCDKTKVKRGPWSPEEDATLIRYLDTHGTGGNWIALPQKAGLRRCGKSCRLRWLNYLRPDIKHGNFTEDEDEIICTLYNQMGSRWSLIASSLPGRTDNDVKNYWNTKLKKKLLAGKVIVTNKIINSKKLHGSCPDLLDSSTPSTYHHHLHFSSVSSQPQISSSPFPILPGTGYGSTHFPHPEMAAGVSEFSTNMKNSSSPIFTPSQDSADSGLAVGTINGGTKSSTVEDGGILMDFGFGNGAPYNYYEYIMDSDHWFQDQKASRDDDAEAALSYCYPNLVESSSYADIKPQGLNQSVINQY